MHYITVTFTVLKRDLHAVVETATGIVYRNVECTLNVCDLNKTNNYRVRVDKILMI